MQLPLTLDRTEQFAVTHCRAVDPDTSWEAAKSMRSAANAQCAAVLNALRQLGTAGAEQIGARCGLPAYAVRKRTSDLEHAGLIATTGETRKTSSGRSERLWVVV